MRLPILFFIGAILLSNCADNTEQTISPDQQKSLINQSRTASKALMSTLQSQLKSSIKKDGTAGAVDTCSVIAPAIASQVEKDHKLQIRRVSLKNRNPHGKPDTFEKKQLKAWHQAPASPPESSKDKEVYKVVQKNGELHFRYMKPIRIQQACLQCHGQSVSPQVQAAIQKKYPKDLATGYSLNDLRGAVSVNIKIPPKM